MEYVQNKNMSFLKRNKYHEQNMNGNKAQLPEDHRPYYPKNCMIRPTFAICWRKGISQFTKRLFRNVFGDQYEFQLVSARQVVKDGVTQTIRTYRCLGCIKGELMALAPDRPSFPLLTLFYRFLLRS